MHVGDRVKIDGYLATVVVLFAERAYAEGYSPAEWAYLQTGILVVDDAVGIIHYPDLHGLVIEHLNG